MRKLILVNRDNPVPPDYPDSVEIVEIEVEEGFPFPWKRRPPNSTRK